MWLIRLADEASLLQCSTERPQCSSCIRLEVGCVYEAVNPGNNVQTTHRLKELETLNRWHEELYDILKDSSEKDAAAVIELIRAGVDVETVVCHVKHSGLLLQLSATPTTN
jgi:hypothetical protein